MPRSFLKFGLLLASWFAALWGVLQTYRLESWFGHALCGPWGCGPPVAALVGYHGFWLVLLLPVAWMLQRRLSLDLLRRWGTRLWGVAGAVIIGLLIVDGWGNTAAQEYPLRWCLFRVATFVDFPVVQFGLLGLLLSRARQAVQGEDSYGR